MTYQEDKSLVRTGNAPRVMASLRNLDLGHWMWWPAKLARKPDPAPAQLSKERAAGTIAG